MDDPANLLWPAAALFLALALLAAWADHRRAKRRDIDRPGWVPWTGIQIFAFLLALVAAALAIRG